MQGCALWESSHSELLAREEERRNAGRRSERRREESDIVFVGFVIVLMA